MNKSNNNWIKILIFYICIYPIFAYSQQSAKVDDEIKAKLKKWDIVIGQGNKEMNGVFAHFIKKDGQWLLNSFSTVRPIVKSFDAEEVLVFSSNYRHVQPDFRTALIAKKTGDFECWTGLLRTRVDNRMTDYNPCESSLTSVSSYDATSNVALTVFSFGISAALGTTSHEVVVDPIKVVSLIEVSHLMEKIEDIKKEEWLSNYKNQFTAINSSKAIDDFVRKYADHDPENLVPQAQSRRDELVAQEAAQAKAKQEASEKAEKDRQEAKMRAEIERQAAAEKAEKERQIEEQNAVALAKETEKMRKKVTAEFRAKLAIGNDTFCGPVINLRGPMVQIAINAPLPGFTAEPWLKKDEVYPASIAGCSNRNGRLSPIWQ